MNDAPFLIEQAPLAPRLPLCVADALTIGSVTPELAERLAHAGLPVTLASGTCVIDGELGHPLNDALALIAAWLHNERLASAWRNELLAVSDAAGNDVARIERAAVRPLGIATKAVHLIGWSEFGGMWVQQRAFDKATDPGLWDTLMGGLMSADESIATTLTRETWEEAGLRIASLREIVATDLITVRRPVRDGYMIEHIHVFDAIVPAGILPLNQDGEVAAFASLPRADLRARLDAGEFTFEAAHIIERALQRRDD